MSKYKFVKKIHVANEDVKDFQVDPKKYFDSTTWLCCPHCARKMKRKGKKIIQLDTKLEFGFNFYGIVGYCKEHDFIVGPFPVWTEDNCDVIDTWRDKAEALDKIMESREETTKHGGVVLDLKRTIN